MAASVYLEHSEHSPMQTVLSLASRIAASDANGLVLGEAGVGKRVLALHLHERSPRSANNVTELMCAGASEEALQRALFGDSDTLDYRGGLFGAARGGTLILHEIAALPLRLQQTLTNALFMTRSADAFDPERPVRLIATSSRDLHGMVLDASLQRDLFDLLSCRLEVPPLRARPADIAPIMRAVWSRLRQPGEITAGAMDLLLLQEWAGNVRQLETFAQRLAVSIAGDRVAVADVHRELGTAASQRAEPCTHAPPLTLYALDHDSIVQQVRVTGMRSFLESVEGSLIDWALTETGGRPYAAAHLLGLKRTTLVEKLRRRSSHSCSFAS